MICHIAVSLEKLPSKIKTKLDESIKQDFNKSLCIRNDSQFKFWVFYRRLHIPFPKSSDFGKLEKDNQLYEMSLSFISMYFKEYYKGKSFKTYTKISKSK